MAEAPITMILSRNKASNARTSSALSATERNAGRIITSPVADFHVQEKPVIESGRVLPVAFGVPLLLGGLLVWRIRRRS